jgi:hypothetical protein
VNAGAAPSARALLLDTQCHRLSLAIRRSRAAERRGFPGSGAASSQRQADVGFPVGQADTSVSAIARASIWFRSAIEHASHLVAYDEQIIRFATERGGRYGFTVSV